MNLIVIWVCKHIYFFTILYQVLTPFLGCYTQVKSIVFRPSETFIPKIFEFLHFYTQESAGPPKPANPINTRLCRVL